MEYKSYSRLYLYVCRLCVLDVSKSHNILLRVLKMSPNEDPNNPLVFPMTSNDL